MVACTIGYPIGFYMPRDDEQVNKDVHGLVDAMLRNDRKLTALCYSNQSSGPILCCIELHCNISHAHYDRVSGFYR